MCTKPPVFFSDRKCFKCNASGHLSKDCPKRKAIKACTEAPGAAAVNAVGPSRPPAASSTVGQGRLNGFRMVDEGPQIDAAIKEAEDESKQEAALQRLPETLRRSGTPGVPDEAIWRNAKTTRVPRPIADHVGRFH